MAIKNEYIFEGHTIRGFSYATITDTYVARPWIRMTYVDEVAFIFLCEQGAAGADPTLKWEAKGAASAASASSIKPEYIIYKNANTPGTLYNEAWSDGSGRFDDSSKEYTDGDASAEIAQIVVASFFPETIVRQQGDNEWVDLRIAIKGAAADTGEHYMVTELVRRKDDEPLFSKINAGLVK